jgi:hypothetical protein
MKKLTITILLSLLLTLAIAGAVKAAELYPTQPSTFTVLRNSTIGGTSGTAVNNTRGYVYYVNLDESAGTYKWKAYVGNVTGEYALQDASGNAIYDWDIATVKGEIYATKEAPSGGSGRFAGGVPDWTLVTCANSTIIYDEESQFNHTITDEDTYRATFKNANSFNLTSFYAGTKQVTDSTVIGGEAGGCFGAYLMQNNTDQYTNWQEVVLTDTTYQDMGSGDLDYDVVYAALMQNNVYGFDSTLYDFQILLPESGLAGTQANTVYYFYVELV